MPDRNDRSASVHDLKVSGTVEGEDFAGARIGVAPVREPRDLPRTLVEKGQRFGVRNPLQLRLGVTLGLLFDCREPYSPTVRLGLDNSDGPPVGEEYVVRRSNIGLVFAHRDSEPRVEVERVLVLHLPAGRPKSTVDPVAGDLFRGLIHVRCHAVAHAITVLSRTLGIGWALATAIHFPDRTKTSARRRPRWGPVLIAAPRSRDPRSQRRCCGIHRCSASRRQVRAWPRRRQEKRPARDRLALLLAVASPP